MAINPRWQMAGVGALEGATLWLIVDHWPHTPHAAALAGAVGAALGAGAAVQHFARTGRHPERLTALAVTTGLLMAAVTFWVCWQLAPVGAPYHGDSDRIVSWSLAAPVALFAAGPFLQVYQATGQMRFPYPELYRHAWTNLFLAGLAALAALALWAVLALWAGLFHLIGIDFFRHWFSEHACVFSVTGGAVGYGLAAGQESERAIAALRNLSRSLFRGLLPLTAVVTLGFLASLPATGLHPLFATGSASLILMGWIAAYVLLLNAVYADGRTPPPFSAVTRRLVEVGAISLAVMGGLALYAIQLRIHQHGLTTQRMYVLVVGIVLAAYAAGCAVAVLLGGAPWLPLLRRLNVGFAATVIALALLLHTPALDPLGWSVRNQVARLRRGDVAPANFDFGYLRFSLGRRGYEALQRLENAPPHRDADVTRQRIRQALAVSDYWKWRTSWGKSSVGERFATLPGAPALPASFAHALSAQPWDRWLEKCTSEHPCLVVPLDLDADGRNEELVAIPGGDRPSLVAFKQRKEGTWRRVGVLLPIGRKEPPASGRDWWQAIQSRDYRTLSSGYRDVQIAGWRLRLR